MTSDYVGSTDCSEVVLRAFEYIDQEMAAPDCERIKAHLDQCRDCLSEYHRDMLLKSLVRRSCQHEPAPVALRMQIMAQITHITVELRD